MYFDLRHHFTDDDIERAKELVKNDKTQKRMLELALREIDAQVWEREKHTIPPQTVEKVDGWNLAPLYSLWREMTHP